MKLKQQPIVKKATRKADIGSDDELDKKELKFDDKLRQSRNNFMKPV